MFRSLSRAAVVTVAAAVAVSCSDNSSNSDPSTSATALQSVTFGPATAQHPGGTVAMQFNGAMMRGMEQYVDMHQGDTTGSQVPISCSMSADRAMISCAPNTALTPGAQYTLHMGAGMMGSNGTAVDMSAGMGMGGEWMTSGMMGGHNGTMMGSGWTDVAGHGGLLFTFTAS